MAYDKKTKRLFAGCDKLLAVINAEDGSVVLTLPIGDGCDGVGFDANTKNIFTSNGEGTMSVFHESTADKYEAVATVTTKRGARTIAVNDQKHLVYLPTANFDEPAPQPDGKPGRPRMIPGTFQVLVVGQ